MTRMSVQCAAALFLGTLFLGSGCGVGMDAHYLETGGDFGATQGGVQDMGLARELIENGRVPPAETFTVEGMFSEHDLPVAGAACNTTLCLRGARALAPDLDGQQSAWLQIGLSSTIDPEQYQRPSVTLVATVDVSGSMGWGYRREDGRYPTPGAVSRALLHEMAKQLNAQDRLAIVTYGSTVHTLLEATPGDDTQTIEAAIDSLNAAGSTNMEGGLQRAYELARKIEAPTDQVRIVLFTDVQPNVGATQPTQFQEMAAQGAEFGIGLTVMGVGVGLGQELMNAMVHLKGGNAFSLFDLEDVEELMDEHWPWLMSPIAYDLAVTLNPCSGYEVVEAYGFPGQPDEDSVSLDVASVFLSRKKGALLLRLAPLANRALRDLTIEGVLSYRTVAGQTIQQSLPIGYQADIPDQRGIYYQQPGTGKTVALAVTVSGMKQAAQHYQEDRERAIQLMQTVTQRLRADAESLNDPALDPELTLAENLLALMQQGAPQGNLYGAY